MFYAFLAGFVVVRQALAQPGELHYEIVWTGAREFKMMLEMPDISDMPEHRCVCRSVFNETNRCSNQATQEDGLCDECRADILCRAHLAAWRSREPHQATHTQEHDQRDVRMPR